MSKQDISYEQSANYCHKGGHASGCHFLLTL